MFSVFHDFSTVNFTKSRNHASIFTPKKFNLLDKYQKASGVHQIKINFKQLII